MDLFPSCTWERRCGKSCALSLPKIRRLGTAGHTTVKRVDEAQLRGEVRSQVQLGNEEIGNEEKPGKPVDGCPLPQIKFYPKRGMLTGRREIV